jgi:pyruvoyl-dependent arginine decarboxylase (PvlArgDC)
MPINTILPRITAPFATALCALTLVNSAWAQNGSLASTLDVYVFPSSGQEASQQSKDESECYQWAVNNAGVDPFDLAKQQTASEQQAQAEMQAAEQAGKGSKLRGALGGAAVGAVVGEVASDDAGEGAAWGAAAGVLRGRRKGRQAEEAAVEQAEQAQETREAHSEEELSNFKKAFSVCLEAKEYMVKY